MKVIDLLIDIKEDKLLPNKIKVSDYIYELDINELQYYRCLDKEKELYRCLLEDISLHNAYVWLNLEYEIKEENKDIEEVNTTSENTLFTMQCYTGLPERAADWNFDILINKINELVKEVNKLKKEAKNE